MSVSGDDPLAPRSHIVSRRGILRRPMETPEQRHERQLRELGLIILRGKGGPGPDPHEEHRLDPQKEQEAARIHERHRREQKARWPAQVRQHVAFATALSGMSAGRTKRFLSWLRDQPHGDRGGGECG
jgi:hypothetical protein